MAWVRRLPSGNWAATVRVPVTPEHPSGRITETFALEAQAKHWAKEQEVDARRGDWIDPRKGEITIAAWWSPTGASWKSAGC